MDVFILLPFKQLVFIKLFKNFCLFKTVVVYCLWIMAFSISKYTVTQRKYCITGSLYTKMRYKIKIDRKTNFCRHQSLITNLTLMNDKEFKAK